MKIFSFKNLIMLNFLLSNMMFTLNRKHLLIILLSLELIMLNMFLLIFNFMLMSMMNSIYFLVMFMVLMFVSGCWVSLFLSMWFESMGEIMFEFTVFLF
uniref:NADH dehydrogenase subunit 4L n=1 Tax=Phryganopsyche latipennis TaxID=177652 RepID=A0A4Y1JWQ3_9NEOP|nr:NADH dehydrogenase subunit 4L [Phryganopsyche latipennis]APQ47899.1 NADH dehydrogenase subunit 4L [Phryganopsyche latipennis]